MSVRCGLTGETVTDPARVAIMRTQRIRWIDHFSWPWMVAMGNENQAEDLVPRNAMGVLDEDDLIYIPKLNGIYVFENEERVTWYAQANMVSFRGKLYHVIAQHHNLLAAYAWLINQKVKDAQFLSVSGSDLECRLINGNLLKIYGSVIDRYSGRIQEFGRATITCIQMIPPVQWWQAPCTYGADVRNIYAPHDKVTTSLLKLQRAIKTWCRRRKAHWHNTLRRLGWFSILNDDLFELIIQQAFKAAPLRCIRLRLELPLRPSA
jgi:hypothetical protein